MVAAGQVSTPARIADACALSETLRHELIRQASQLPQVMRYFDDYDEVERSVRAAEPAWRIRLNGATSIVRVGSIEAAHRDLLHALAVVGLSSAPMGTRDALGHLMAHPTLLQRTAEAALQGPVVGLSFARSALGQLAPHEWAFTAAWQDLRAAVVLYWNYSNGFRPIQIAKLNVDDVRVRAGPHEHPTASVVVRVPYVKQRRCGIKKYSPRRMRRTWTPMMLGQSPVFRKLDAQIKRRSISTSEHARLDPDHQVMNAPNGHPIVGIGGCAMGQSFCTKTPALACYTCPKFMFLRDDAQVHRNALAAAQSIVREFLNASPTGRNLPAFAQLRQTIEVMEAVIADIEEDRA